MNLVIDIGNTMVKYHVFDHPEELFTQSSPELSFDIIQSILNKYPIRGSIWSSVRKIDPNIIKELNTLLPQAKAFTHQTSIPLHNQYKTPETLGLDRLAAAIGAHQMFPDNDLLIFDFGTALTIDFVDASANYCGGNISPGLNTRFKALHTFTGKLPLQEPDMKLSDLGKTTQEAINNGVINGMVFEVKGYINFYATNSKKLKVVGTGGDAKIFDSLLKNTIFVVENLVALGLNSILKSNA